MHVMYGTWDADLEITAHHQEGSVDSPPLSPQKHDDRAHHGSCG